MKKKSQPILWLIRFDCSDIIAIWGKPLICRSARTLLTEKQTGAIWEPHKKAFFLLLDGNNGHKHSSGQSELSEGKVKLARGR